MSPHPKVIAKEVALRVGLPATWPNVNVIAAALEFEAEASGAPIPEVAEMIVRAAKERVRSSGYCCPAEWEVREEFRLNDVNRFWFEDARWRFKFAYAEFNADSRQSERSRPVAENRIRCWKCEGTGIVWNDGPGPRKIPCPDCKSEAA